uniref:Uncharacterized protein n=1 Tax=Cacopsylla melanoneura TaxID=428564 RepID=A0A8D9BBL5_9HEMI
MADFDKQVYEVCNFIQGRWVYVPPLYSFLRGGKTIQTFVFVDLHPIVWISSNNRGLFRHSQLPWRSGHYTHLACGGAGFDSWRLHKNLPLELGVKGLSKEAT